MSSNIDLFPKFVETKGVGSAYYFRHEALLNLLLSHLLFNLPLVLVVFSHIASWWCLFAGFYYAVLFM